MKTIAEILKRRIDELGVDDLKDCARQFDLPYELLRKVISDGHMPKDKTLLLYAKAFDLNAAELISTAYRQRAPDHLQYLFDSPRGVTPVPAPDTAQMAPVLGRAACGAWLETHQMEPGVMEPVDLMDPDAFFVIAEGDSMIGGNIPSGAYLLVSPGARVSNGNIVLARRGEEEVTVKTIYRQGDGSTILQPMNPAFEPIIIPAGEPMSALRVLEVRVKL